MVCIFHGYVLSQDFHILNFTDQCVAKFEDFCSQPHSYEESALIFTSSIIKITKVRLNQVAH